MASNIINIIDILGQFKYDLLMQECEFWKHCELSFESLEETMNLNNICYFDDDEEDGVYL